jgi:topoisomerase-4 subunit A
VAVADEPVTVILSQNGWVRSRQGHGIDLSTVGYKTGDFPFLVAESRTVWPLVIIDSLGRAYSVRVADLPTGRGDGVPITTLIEFQDGAHLTQALSDTPQAHYVFANSGGYGFIAAMADLVSRNRSGKAFMALDKGEKPLRPAKVAGNTLAAISQTGRLLVFPLAELKAMAKGRGLIIQNLGPKDELVAITTGDGTAFTVTGAGRTGKVSAWQAKGKDLASYCGSRAKKGQNIPAKFKPTGFGA